MYAASYGRKMLFDKFTKEIVWIEGPANHTPPQGMYPDAELTTIHECISADPYKVGDTYNV